MFVDGGVGRRAVAARRSTADSPATGEAIGEVPQGDREDAQRAIAAANAPPTAWARTTAFERAAAMHRVADEIEQRRDDARAHADARPGQAAARSRTTRSRSSSPYWRNAAEDGKRLEGRLAELVLAGQARAARAPAARRDRRDHAVELAVHDAGRADRARARLRQHRRLDARVDARRSPRSRSPSASPRPTCRPASSTSSPGPGSVVGDEIARNPGTHGVGFIGSTETGRKVAEAAAGKAAGARARRQRARRRAWTTPTSTLAAEATVTACFLCAGQSCTAGERLLVHRAVREEFVARLARARRRAGRARRSVRRRRRRSGPLNNAGVAEKMDEHVADALERGATRRRAAARAPAASRPTSTGRRRCSTASRPTRSSRRRRRSARSRRSSRSTRSTRRSSSRTRRRTACSRRSSRATCAQGLRYADAVRTGWVNINESSNYWESAPAVRRPLRHARAASAGSAAAAPMESFTELQTVVDRVTLRLRDRRRRLGGLRARDRLSADPSTRVLVLEAGRPDSWWDLYIHMPAALAFPIGNRFYDWKYESEPEPFMNGRRDLPRARQGARRVELDQRDDLPARQPARLRALGADAGSTSWDYAHCLPYFKRMETCLAGADE